MSPRERLWSWYLRYGPVAARAVAVLVVAALVLGLANEAWARVGGGHGSSGGSRGRSSGGGGFRSSGSSGFRGGGGGGGDGDGLALLVWLFWEHPLIGLALVVGVIVYSRYAQRSRTQAGTWRGEPAPVPAAGGGGVRGRGAPAGLRALQEGDPSFSLPLFIDFALLVVARAHRAGGAAAAEAALAPWLTEEARGALRALHPSGSRVLEVIVGTAAVHHADAGSSRSRIVLDLTLNLLSSVGGEERQVLVEERWTFSRAAGVVSPPPERLVVLCCAACGSSAEPRPDGTCVSCGVPRTNGASHWVVSAVARHHIEAVSRPDLTLGGGVEEGTRLPTVLAPDLVAARRAFEARHPDFSWSAFRATVVDTFLRLQAAWAAGKWEGARPYETDALFQQHRFWMERYARAGLRNANADVSVERVELCAVGRDAWLESVTVRVFARMKDWTEETATGRVVGGSKTEPRVFSEYWTFIRAVGGKRRADGGADNCPSCGAPLDRVSMAGVCGYCEAHITSGEFDWVLSRIEQDEVYGG